MRVGAGTVKVSVSMLMLLLGCFSLRAQVAHEIKITFPQGKTQIDREFGNNARSLFALDSLLGDPSILSAPKIFIRSASSPEGPLWLNRKLSMERSMALKRYVLLHHPVLEGKLSFYAIPEDWSLIPEEGTGDKSLLLDYTRLLPSARYAKLFWVQESSLPALMGTPQGLPALSFPVGRMAPLPERPAPSDSWILRPVLSVGTNLLSDLAFSPTLFIDVPIGKKWSVWGEYSFPWWLARGNDRAWQILKWDFGPRYWFKSDKGRSPMDVLLGHYVALDLGAGYYDIEPHHTGYQGEFQTIGIEYGHAWRLWQRWRLEAFVGIGWMGTHYRYYQGNEGDTKLYYQHDGKYTWFGPTRIGVNLKYIFCVKRRVGHDE